MIIVLVLIAIFGGPIASNITGHPQNTDLREHDRRLSACLSARTRISGSAPTPQGATSSSERCTAPAPRSSSGVVASGFAVLIGLIVGLTAGFFGGWVDTILSRAADVLLAVPQILIAVGIVAACSA